MGEQGGAPEGYGGARIKKVDGFPMTGIPADWLHILNVRIAGYTLPGLATFSCGAGESWQGAEGAARNGARPVDGRRGQQVLRLAWRVGRH